MRRPIAQLCFALALAVPAGAAASPGGAPSAPPPEIDEVQCRRDCEGGVARPGSKLTVTGKGMQDVATVRFTGSPLAGDEVATAPAGDAEADKLAVVVPDGAASGPLVLVDGFGQESEPSAALAIEEAAAPKRTRGPIATVVTGRKAFVDGLRVPTLTYRLQTDVPAEVTVDVVRQASGKVVERFEEGVVEPGVDERVAWAGARQGRYRFVVRALVEGGGTASSARSSSPDGFVLLGHKFPVRARHDYGDGFGAGRGHEGADVFAACGSPIVAARGGRVKIKKFHSRAGNYIVIDGAQTGVDYIYAHLRDAALVDQGERFHTGDPIGYVGDTGRAYGCHLHFEMWSAPGWYTGGSPFDPVPSLRAWDELS